MFFFIFMHECEQANNNNEKKRRRNLYISNKKYQN